MDKQELGLRGTFGSFALADDEDERDFYLLLEKYFTGLELQRVKIKIELSHQIEKTRMIEFFSL